MSEEDLPDYVKEALADQVEEYLRLFHYIKATYPDLPPTTIHALLIDDKLDSIRNDLENILDTLNQGER